MTSNTILNPLPTRRKLIKATVISIVVAAVILVTTVLPAEHNIDPTGIGRKLGLLGMSAGAPPPKPVAPAPAAPAGAAPAAPANLVSNAYVIQSATPFRTTEMQVTLAPNQGAEIKARMRKGEHYTFNWSTGAGPVEFDMHGEETNAAKDAFTSYWQADAAAAAGTFTAPFEGTHGWYWHNNGAAPVTVTVTVSGFYSELFRP